MNNNPPEEAPKRTVCQKVPRATWEFQGKELTLITTEKSGFVAKMCSEYWDLKIPRMCY